MRIIYMGSPDFASPTLKILIESDHEVVAVVTKPDRPRGRGQEMQPTPIKQVALRAGLEVLEPEKADQPEFIQKARELRPDVIIVVAYGQILKRELLDLPKLFCMNLHASLLPKYRGAAPINWSILNGDRETGVTTMKMDSGLDAGDILLKRIISIEESDDSQTITDRLSIEGAILVLETIKKLKDGMLSPESQNHNDATHAPKLTKDLGLIHWDQPSKVIRNKIRGLRPWPSAYSFYQGKRLEILKAKTSVGEPNEEPGTIARVSDFGLEVGTGDGRLIITELKPEGKRAMSAKSFLQGHAIGHGSRFDKCNMPESAA